MGVCGVIQAKVVLKHVAVLNLAVNYTGLQTASVPDFVGVTHVLARDTRSRWAQQDNLGLADEGAGRERESTATGKTQGYLVPVCPSALPDDADATTLRSVLITEITNPNPEHS